MQEKKKAYLELHLAVLLYGLTAIFGDLISLSAIVLVWWRVGLTSISMCLSNKIYTTLKALSRNQQSTLFIIGVLIALHWIAFYGSIKLANASVALIGMSTLSLFTALLEPIFFRRRLDRIDIVFGIAMIPALWLIANILDVSMYAGLMVGIIASFLLALFGVLNKKFVSYSDPFTLTFIEMSSAWIFITILLPFVLLGSEIHFMPTGMDWVYLLILALICTRLAFFLNIRALQHLSAFTSNLIFNLESIYGIILAIIILHDHKELSPRFYLGALLIIFLVLGHPIVKRKLNKVKT